MSKPNFHIVRGKPKERSNKENLGKRLQDALHNWAHEKGMSGIDYSKSAESENNEEVKR